MSEHVDHIKKKPSGSKYRKRKAEKEKEFQRTKKFMNIVKYITTKNEDLNMPSSSGMEMNVSIAEPLSDKSDQMIGDCVEEIVDKVSQKNEISVKEHFLEFIPVNESTGEILTEVIINVSNKYGLELNDCRGQGYDNGAYMKGKNIGVQTRILNINPLAVYVPCGCHSYNLVLCDAAKSSEKSVTLFGILQRLFTLFSASVHRWKILTDHLGLSTIKKLSHTRWEARISSVKAVRYQISAIHDALITLAIETQKTDV
ncbi:hypothetical protein JTB14_019590 [Gonioctena quinquepunctata]|nr:hypothetical protein JTB14_019590 [Gonioctena quinquepunctata]